MTATLSKTRTRSLAGKENRRTPFALYVRLSTRPKRGRSSRDKAPSIERQLERGRALAARLGVPVVVYNEGITSAFKGKRPVYERMVEDLHDGRIAGVIAWDMDRLHRNNRELLDWIDLTEQLDFPTHTDTAGLMDLATPQGRASAIIFGALKRQESEHRSERVMDEFKEKALRGEFLGGVRPFGYESDGIEIRWSEAKELLAATRAVIAGESLKSIINDWNTRKILTTKGNKWTYPSLTAVLLRPRNAGWMQYQGKVVGKALWDAIVPEDEFLAVQKILSDPKRRTSPGNARSHLLSGLARCGKCQKPMLSGRVSDRTKKSYLVYRCCVYRSEPKLDALVERTVLLLLLNRKARSLLVPKKTSNRNLQRERDEISDQMNAAAESCAEGKITLPQLEIMNKTAQKKLDALDNLLADTSRVRVFGELLSVPDLVKTWKSLSLSRKRAVIDALMNITVNPVGKGSKKNFRDGITIDLKGDVPMNKKDLTDAILAAKISTEQEREITRIFSVAA